MNPDANAPKVRKPKPDVHTFRAQVEGTSRSEAKARNHADQYVIIRRRKMTHAQWLRLRRAARKMVQDVRKYIKRKRL
jgi:hypothetical protein